ncbi:hypothetical protein DFH06DRAFT_1290616 [Mycena polygramma]|nr:hypothetical protein DFH06DRAFT_1290616 [Mycena polygramma]
MPGISRSNLKKAGDVKALKDEAKKANQRNFQRKVLILSRISSQRRKFTTPSDGSLSEMADDSLESDIPFLASNETVDCAPHSPSQSPVQILVTRPGSIHIRNCGLDLWIHHTFFVVRFGTSGSYVADLLRIVEGTNLVAQRMDNDCLSVHLVDSSPTDGQEMVPQDGIKRRSSYITEEAICIRQPGSYLYANINKGNLRFGRLNSPPQSAAEDEATDICVIPQKIDGSAPFFPLVRSPFISVDVRSDGNQMDFVWELTA